VSTESYRFKVGSIECIAVSDGTFVYAPDTFVANAPLERFEQELRYHSLPTNEIITPYTCLLVNTGKHRLLIATGAGFAPTNGKLAAGLRPDPGLGHGHQAPDSRPRRRPGAGARVPLPIPRDGRVLSKAEAWQWQPIETFDQAADSRAVGV
jgi:hypothetical protein